ncbi:endonuclease domain-containing protein [Sphingomonas faeni]|uniref:endonuclease domain-containing protein n=1 Tax=Sphingomonas faeni TaxID=185950 RepID=UPI0033607242
MVKERRREGYPGSARDAVALGLPHYFNGVPCPRGHVGLRKAYNNACADCRHRSKRKTPERELEKKREANRRERLSRRGGCTPEMKAALIASQDGKCATCATTAELFVDHCHVSGKIRAALCRSCNLALGMVKDRPELLRTLAEYLEAHR